MQEFNHVTSDLFDLSRQLGKLHNQVCFKKIDQSEMYNFTIVNKEKLNHPYLVSILLENIELTTNFISENLDFCKTVKEIIENTNFNGADMGLRSGMRLGMFNELMKAE
jgi:hypothetical protein